MVKVYSPNKTVIEENELALHSNSGYYTTTKGYVKTGKWYYEITHISGSEMFISGFANQNSTRHISFFPYKIHLYSNTCLYFVGVDPDGYNNYGDLKLVTYSKGKTFGIGLDIDNTMFYIRSDYEIRVIKFNSPKDHWSPVFFETYADGHNDTFSLNFGDEPFVYPPPFDFTPWSSMSPPAHSCVGDRSHHMLILFLINIILFL